jgi:hypothetical protein
MVAGIEAELLLQVENLKKEEKPTDIKRKGNGRNTKRTISRTFFLLQK